VSTAALRSARGNVRPESRRSGDPERTAGEDWTNVRQVDKRLIGWKRVEMQAIWTDGRGLLCRAAFCDRLIGTRVRGARGRG
jgi:hypothetical protein